MAAIYQTRPGLPLQITAQVILPQLFDGLGRSRFDGPNAPPVEPGKQRLELGMAQRHQPVPDARAR